jgi:hypothetical protein
VVTSLSLGVRNAVLQICSGSLAIPLTKPPSFPRTSYDCTPITLILLILLVPPMAQDVRLFLDHRDLEPCM